MPNIDSVFHDGARLSQQFQYIGRNASGEQVTGELSAPSEDVLRQRLKDSGVLLVQAKSVGGGALGLRRRGRISLQALVNFFREFQTLTAAGIPVTKALAMLGDREDDLRLSAALAGLRTEVERGTDLADAMELFPNAFEPLVRESVRVGAQTGEMEAAIARLIGFLELRGQIQRKIRRAMTYPMFLLGLLFFVLAGLMLFVLPRFAVLYEEFDSELPLATRILMALVNTAPVWVPSVIVGMLFLAVASRWAMQKPAIANVIDRLRLRLPVAGPVYRDLLAVHIAHMMGLLLGSGAALPAALKHTSDSVPNRIAARRLAEIRQDVVQGKSLSNAMEGRELFSKTSRSLIEAGEASGELDKMFEAVSSVHEQRLDDRVARLLALIEPMMMLLVGGVLGTVIIAVYLPIFGLSNVIR